MWTSYILAGRFAVCVADSEWCDSLVAVVSDVDNGWYLELLVFLVDVANDEIDI